MKRGKALGAAGLLLGLCACSGGGSGGTPQVTAPPVNPDPAQRHLLFVGDSFTYGRYQPVRQYNGGGTQTPAGGSALVVDENYRQTGARAETSETGPFGGIPGIFAELAVEKGLDYDVHIEAIAATSLQTHYAVASGVIDDAKWNAVVLQELSARPLTGALTGSTQSDPANFCKSVQTIEQGVHAAAPSAAIYLYETWPQGEWAQALAGAPTSSGFATAYANALAATGAAYHNVYYRAAALDGAIAAVAPAGEAWSRAWAEGIANPDPYAGTAPGPLLWYGIEAVNDPAISSPDYHHPGIDGAYLSALVLFQQIAGIDVRTLGSGETAATALGIPAAQAVQLQQVAWETVTQESSAPINQGVDPCSVTQ
ncbi:MAG: hypothetical protein ACHQIO_05365 [Nevskiales bacterium]